MTAKKKDDNLKAKLEKARKDEEENRAKEEAAISGNDTSDVGKLKEELTQMTETAKLAMADLQNLKRRTEEERAAVFAMASAELITRLLPILDNLNRATQHIPEGADDWYKGVEMCITNLNTTLEEAGLTRMETTEKEFNPNLHEAVMQGPGKQNIITEELEAGYTLGERVIRHAKVKVGNGEKG